MTEKDFIGHDTTPGFDMQYFGDMCGALANAAVNVETLGAKNLVAECGATVSTSDMRLMLVGATSVATLVGAYLSGETMLPKDPVTWVMEVSANLRRHIDNGTLGESVE